LTATAQRTMNSIYYYSVPRHSNEIDKIDVQMLLLQGVKKMIIFNLFFVIFFNSSATVQIIFE